MMNIITYRQANLFCFSVLFYSNKHLISLQNKINTNLQYVYGTFNFFLLFSHVYEFLNYLLRSLYL